MNHDSCVTVRLRKSEAKALLIRLARGSGGVKLSKASIAAVFKIADALRNKGDGK